MNSLRRQLVLRLSLGLALLLGLGGAGIYLSARLALYREFDAGLRVKAIAMVAMTKPTHEQVEFELPRRMSPVAGSTNLLGFYQLFSSNGAVLLRSPALGQTDLPCRLGTLTAPEFWDLTLPDGSPGRAIGLAFVARPPPPKERKPSAAEPVPPTPPRPPPEPVSLGLVLADGRGHIDSALRSLALILLAAGSLTILAAAGLVALVSRRTLAPLDDLAGRANRIDATTLQSRFPTDGVPAELAPISARLNDLLARLEGSFERERRFSADLAHEIRTPIAELRSLAEVKLRGATAADRAAFQDALDIALHLESLATGMLALARSEQRSLPVERKPVNVARLVEGLWQSLGARAATKHLTTQFHLPADAVIHTDPTLLRGIVFNLLTNAVDYTPEGGRIEVICSLQAGAFTLTIANTTTGLVASDVPRLFERFWRKDKARHDAEHSGLGLALAKSFAELIAIELTASLTEEGTLTLRLAGPAADAANSPGSER